MSMMTRIRAVARGRSPARSWRARRWVLPVALVALGMLAVAGCGGGSNSSSSDAADSSDSQTVKYAQCMRANGLPSFPDPVNGQLQLTATPGGALDPTSPQFQAAQQACKSLEPPGLQGGTGQNNQQQSQLLKFADCMRENGVADFPDPQNGLFTGGGDLDPNSPEFQSALDACRDLIPGGGVSGGGQ